MKNFEVEQKYRIKNPAPIRRALRGLKAKKISAGAEHNTLYDSAGRLRKRETVLRLRLAPGGKGLLTFKGPRLKGAYKKRVEMETAVDHARMKKILELLGFRPAASYSKYREEYKLGRHHVTIDRLSGKGWFLEIEGAAGGIGRIAKALGLKSKDREDRTYLEILANRKFRGI